MAQKPKKPITHKIEDMLLPSILCSCGWVYVAEVDRHTTKIALENELLDEFSRHSKSGKRPDEETRPKEKDQQKADDEATQNGA